MKIRTKTLPYRDVMALPRPKHRRPMKPNFLLSSVIRAYTQFDLFPMRFQHTNIGMDRIGPDEPCLILMNHSSFVDMEIAYRIFYPRRLGIVCTTDTLVGKSWLIRLLGCIPTQKFVTDLSLIQDMEHMLKVNKSSVLMFPEAGYSFDGTTTTLPRKMGILLKKLGVPVVTVITQGAFARDPLYNMLQKRKVKVSAQVKCIATAEEVKTLSVAELDARIDEAFSFDNFAWQQENNIAIKEVFRADGLHRVLYKCPHCGAEGQTEGKGIHLTCHACGKQYELTEYGYMKATEGETEFSHIPDWYRWEREQIRAELENGTYHMEADVDIAMMVDHKALYRVGEGKLTHTTEGFHLTGCNGELDYTQGPIACHSLNSDYYWYQIGDVISIGNQDGLYYCFPKPGSTAVAKTRLAAEELYKMKKQRRRAPKTQE